MGCVGPKSAISVREDLTFLDLAVQQIEVIGKYCMHVTFLTVDGAVHQQDLRL